jgi:tetratricopeptide (TPR) repeat protein
LQSFGRLQNLESRALSAVLAYTERFARNETSAHERLADESENIIGAAQYAADANRVEVVQQLITALEDKAEEFILERNFWLELEQLKRLQRDAAPMHAAPPRAAAAPTPVVTTPAPPPSLPLPEATPKPEVPEVKVEEKKPEPPAPRSPFPSAPFPPAPPKQAIPKLGLARTETPTAEVKLTPPGTPPDIPLQETAADLTPPEPPLGAGDTEGGSSTAPLSVALDDVDDDTERHTPPSVASIREMLDEARQNGDKHREALLLQSLGQYNMDVGRPDEAAAYFRQSLEAFETVNDADGMLAVLEVLSSLASYNGNAQDALIYATRGINFAQQLDDKSRLGRLQTRLGDIRTSLGDTNAAIETYSTAIETLRDANDSVAVGVAMSKLAGIYLNQARAQDSLQLLEAALPLFQQEHRADQEARTLAKLGSTYTALGDWSKAQEQHEQSALLAKEQFDQAMEAEQYAALGYLRELQRDREGAILYYRRALHAAYQTENVNLQVMCAVQLGEFLIEDTRTLNQGIQLLREASEKSSATEAKRLLGRADQRLRRASGAGMTIPEAESSNRDYAAQAYVA